MKLTLGKVNKKLLLMKAHYFLWNAGTGPVVPFMSTYARQLGFSSAVVGIIYTILPVCGMLAKPIAGAIADRFMIQKKIFLGTIFFIGAAFLSIYYSPKIPLDQEVLFSCNETMAKFDTSPSNISVDDCFVTQLQKESGTVNCKLICEMPDEKLKLTARVNKSETEMVNDIVNFYITKLTGSDGTVYDPICPCGSNCHISVLCDIECDDYNLNDLLAKPSISDNDVYNQYQFWVFLILMIIFWTSQGISISVADTICFELLEDQPHKYGYQRLYGSLGWGIFSIITGLMVDSLNDGSSKRDYISAFYLAVAFLIINLIVAINIKRITLLAALCPSVPSVRPPVHHRNYTYRGERVIDLGYTPIVAYLSLISGYANLALITVTINNHNNFAWRGIAKYVQRKISQNIFKDVGRLLKDIRIVVFLVWCCVVGMCTGLLWTYLFWIIEDLAKDQGCGSQNWVKTLEGIVMGIQCLGGELPFFFLSGIILRKIGHTNAMTLVLAAIGVRYILYSVIPNPWYFLPVELSNGLTFGLFYATMASYASIIAPTGTEATMQGLVGATFEGLGVSLGNLLAGQLYGKYGGAWTYRIFGLGAIVVAILHAGVQFLLSRTEARQKVAKEGSASDNSTSPGNLASEKRSSASEKEESGSDNN